MACPTCKRAVEWNAESPWRPFCSERCKLIDLGAWASETHAIPGDSSVPDDETSPGDSPGTDS
ncbi:MAG TPA: DNA gyrase inhibitor YacG [Steroidobacteraceae bacterium]|nr:DNA gyrase inhibitor YacG [Steroidobacteraceae bacterium]